ncbi:MAG: conjugal transfer protein TraF [Gammaproteobacteria bacterium]|nr:conjugal transfer protein TraF [Gammaproteobacteria bacterium]
MKTKTSIALISGCLLMQTANASFQAQDPRALGMGGVGAAAANSAQAHFYNPSLLVNARESESFNFEIPATAGLTDPDNLLDSIDDFTTKKYIDSFSIALTSINEKIKQQIETPGSLQPSDLIIVRDNLIVASENLQTGINNLSNKSLIGNANLGLMTSSPNGKIGWAGYLNVWVDAGATLYVDPRDDAAITDYIGVIKGLNSLTSLIDIGAGGLPDPVKSLYSKLTLDAVIVKEFGISLAIPYQLNNYSFDVGITPKYMSIQTYSYERTLEESEKNSEVFDFNNSMDYSSFNLDLGLSKKLTENWKSGLVIKNLIPQSFDTLGGSKITIDPAARIGTSYQNNWATVAADIDLTKNKSPIDEAESRYLALGTELDVWLVKLRLGYKTNLAVSNNNIISTGLGLYLFGLNIDAAVAAGKTDINAGLQVGLQW